MRHRTCQDAKLYRAFHIFPDLSLSDTLLPLSHLCHNLNLPHVPIFRDPAVGLKSLYEFVRSGVSSSGGREEETDGAEEWGPPVLLVDDISVLLSLGVSVGAVLDFSHYCRATVCSQLKVRLSLSERDCICLFWIVVN